MDDTIFAIATPPGYGGIGIVRVSGPAVRRIANAMLGRNPIPRRAEYGQFWAHDGTAIDSGIALFFEAPNSFTGEDILELHGHGGIVVQELLCDRIAQLGARIAQPGEFTQRAFLNDRIDLTQAEAVADLINATTKAAARASARSLMGEFSSVVHSLDEQVLRARVHTEAAIDFAEEEIDFLSDRELNSRVQEAKAQVEELLRRVESGVLLQRGLNVVIAGPPNVGKSSLLNALLNEDRAIVTAIAGTTRDTLSDLIQIDGLPVRLTDTAGLHASTDQIEKEGIARATNAIEQADLVLWVTEDQATEDPPPIRVTYFRVWNKCDLTGSTPGQCDDKTVRTSATERTGLEALRTMIRQQSGYVPSEDAFAGRPRHIKLLQETSSILNRVADALKLGAGEIVAEELRLAQDKIGEIVGATTTDELLGEIFSNFCIGK